MPLNGQGERNQVTFHGKGSRLWLKALTPTRLGDLTSYFEMEFFSTQAPGEERTTNAYSPSLRHAYGSLGRFLAGQTWSTFLNANALPELNDSGGSVGRIYTRQPLIRWTQPFDGGDWQVALENPETTLTGANGGRIVPDDDRYPDLVGKVGWRGDWGDVSVAGLTR
ncbi:DcaP family trimeric outer membrane transporter, partial [Methylogaea oryzae]|uniref:DcaP family trimeric outer membrane transporter n=1 Tax=Methylogaea oryzae TaxID=1295382 RepID=UPI0020D08E4E